MDDVAKHDSSSIIEIISQTLEDATQLGSIVSDFNWVLFLLNLKGFPTCDYLGRLRWCSDAMRKVGRGQQCWCSMWLGPNEDDILFFDFKPQILWDLFCNMFGPLFDTSILGRQYSTRVEKPVRNDLPSHAAGPTPDESLLFGPSPKKSHALSCWYLGPIVYYTILIVVHVSMFWHFRYFSINQSWVLCNWDQLWGIISRRIGHESSLQDPADVSEAIAQELSKPSIKDWIGPNTRVCVRKLDCTRDWRNHLPSLGIKLEGGLLKDDEGNHLFLSMRRRGGWYPTVWTCSFNTFEFEQCAQTSLPHK